MEEIDPAWRTYPGLVVCGSHTPHDTEQMIEKIREAREEGLPFYGECLGHQLAALEYARNVLGVKDATSEEFGQGTFVVKKRKEGLNVGLHNGESYWNRYEVDPKVEAQWVKLPNFFTIQAHASYQSSKNKPHPLIKAFLAYARKMAV